MIILMVYVKKDLFEIFNVFWLSCKDVFFIFVLLVSFFVVLVICLIFFKFREGLVVWVF